MAQAKIFLFKPLIRVDIRGTAAKRRAKQKDGEGEAKGRRGPLTIRAMHPN